MDKLFKKIKTIIKDKELSFLSAHAAACAYYTILAFIPLLLLILTLTKYIGIDNELLISILEGIIPTNILNEAVINIVKEVYSKSIGTITISATVTLWSSGKGFFALCKGLNVAYELEEKYNYMKFRLKSIIYTIVFIICISISLLLLVFGNQINIILQRKFNILSEIIQLIIKSKVVWSIILLSIVFAILYRFIPKHNYSIKTQIPGAIFAAIACNIISIFYSIYIDLFTGFSLMYGSLTTIVLAMMWVYACMYSILLGAIINKSLLKNKSSY